MTTRMEAMTTPRGMDRSFIVPTTRAGLDDLVVKQVKELGDRQITHLDFFDRKYGNLYGIMKAMHQAITEVHDIDNAFDVILSPDFMPEGARQHTFPEGQASDSLVRALASHKIKVEYENATRRIEGRFNALFKRIERLPAPCGSKIVGTRGTYEQQIVSMKFCVMKRDHAEYANSLSGTKHKVIVRYRGLSHMTWAVDHGLLLFKFNGFNMKAYCRLY